ncbi:MAG: pyridoxamine 5'-phosphate oxidase family protein [Treponema sp.]|nr:pyridoxamine 5'-phosphate oxidase family protein [Treponema sp.]
MFRQMRRFKQQLQHEECISILKNEPRGVLSLIGDEGYPYCIPLTHFYNEKDGKIYFHGAKTGHKIDAIKNCDKACFCVYDKGYANEGEWAMNIKSVVAFGRITLVTDIKKAEEICTDLVRKFTDDEAYLKKELDAALSRVQCLAFTIEHITGKRVKEE